MNLKAYAAHRKRLGLRGTSHVAVLKAIDTGRLTEPAVQKVDGRWQIDAPLADAQWAVSTDMSRASEDEIEKSEELLAKRKAPIAQENAPSLAQAQRALAVYKAERERLALMKEKGELVMEADVSRRWFEHGRAIRDNLMSVPDRIASQLAACKDATEAHQLLTAEITGALRVLADG